MTKAEEILEKHLKNNIDQKTYLKGSKLTYDLCIDVINEAINYAHCSLQLKDKEEITFDEWTKENNYRKVYKGYVRNQIHFGDEEMLLRYNYHKRLL